MEEEFVYWRHKTPVGIKVEEVCGGCRYKGRVWEEMARQIYCENGRETFREIGHYANGAPFLFGEDTRISLSHCEGLLVVATLPPTPEVDLSEFSRRSCLGIDAERSDRAQVLKLRERFLSKPELAMIEADDVEANITAWTIKEAAYKAVMKPGLDLCADIKIEEMPDEGTLGSVTVIGECEEPLKVYSYESEGCIVTIAFSPQTSTFCKNKTRQS